MKYNSRKFTLEWLIHDIEVLKTYQEEENKEQINNQYWFICGELSVLMNLHIIDLRQAMNINDKLFSNPDISIKIISNILEAFNRE